MQEYAILNCASCIGSAQVRGHTVYFGAAGAAPLDAVASLHADGPGARLVRRHSDLEGAAPGHPIEWLIDMFTRAERDGCAEEFAEQYAGSALKQVLVDCCMRAVAASKCCGCGDRCSCAPCVVRRTCTCARR